MKIAYIEKKFKQPTLSTIDNANSIIREYQAQGYSLTLRQLYYQLVARGIIPNIIKCYQVFPKSIRKNTPSGFGITDYIIY